MNHAEMKNGPHFEMWVIGVAAGLVAGAVMYVVGQYGFMAAAFVGALVAVVVAAVFGMPKAKFATLPAEEDAGAGDHDVSVPAMAAYVAADPVVSAPVTALLAPVAPVAPVAFTALPAEPVAEPAVVTPATAPAGEKPAAGKPAAKKPAAEKPAKAPAAEKPAAAAKAPKAKKQDGPARLSAPRKGGADDLKEIEGIGPAMEKLVNGLGFYHFDQIAGWSDADVAWVDANMKTFKGRIVRDKWVAQAKIIVAEGLDAFRIRAKTNNY